MDERDGVEWAEQQQAEHRQSLAKKNKSAIKQEKKMSKTESRFKSKLESLRKFQHSASTNSAVEKARAFFRSLELKHLGSSSNSEHSSSRRRTTTNNNNIHSFPSASSSSKLPVPSSISSSSSSSIIDDSHTTTTTDSSFNTKNPSNGVATARIIRIINPNYLNPRDMIVHRVVHNEENESAYFNLQQKYSPILSENNIQSPKQYYNQIPNERSHSYSISFERHGDTRTKYDSRPLSPVSALNSNIGYSNRIYPNSPPSTYSNRNISHQQMSTSLYNYRPMVCREMESPAEMSSSFHEQSHRSDPIIRPLSSSSSSSMSTWTRSVRRLNSEYTSTINALQQAKESLKQIHPIPADTISKYATLVARGINDLSNNEPKKSLGVTFCLTTPISRNSPSPISSSSQISKISLQQSKSLSSAIFNKPKLVRPMELDTFIPSIPKLEPIPSLMETKEKKDSIANIIKKFNNLNISSPITIENYNHSLTSQINNEQRDILPKTRIYDTSLPAEKDYSNISPVTSITSVSTIFSNPSSTPRVHFAHTEPSVTTYELEEIQDESSPPLTSSSSSSSVSDDSTSSTATSSSACDENKPLDNGIQEETTYTVETFYKNTDDNNNNKSNVLSNHNQLVVIRENTTEEQFNFAREKQHQEIKINHQIPFQHTFTINETKVPPLTTPLLTYLNLTAKQTTPTPPPIETQEMIQETYHSVEPLSHITNDFSSNSYHDEDDETISDVVTINPHTQSPSSSHRLISSSSSSSSSTTSSAPTVLLSGNNITPLPISSSVTKIPLRTNGNLIKNNNKSTSQLPKRTATKNTPTITNNSRLKQPPKILPSLSKLKPPSSTITKPIKSPMIANSTASTMTVSMRKPTGITNQSSTMTNTIVNKTIQQQPSSSTLTSGKKQQLVNGTNMTESQNSAESSFTVGKNRVRSMVNQLNAAVSSTRPTVPSAMPGKRISTTISTVNTRHPVLMEPATNSTNKITVTSPNRPVLQRAMTINNSSVTPSPPSTPPTMNNNISSTYKRKTPLIRSTSNVKEGLIRWCQVQVAGYPNISITNLSSSWSDGLAFCALTHHFFPDAFDFKNLSSNNRKDNFELAFRIAEERAGVPQLLDVSDMILMGNTPDYKCIFTYLNSFLAKVKDIHPTSNGVEHH